MRIPLEKLDLQYFLGRITPKLLAAWPQDQLPAGQFEDAVAKFLGYPDHHTLLDCVGEWSAFEDTPISRQGLKEAILWNGFAAGLLSYFKLLEIFPVDDLKYLGADRFTNEGRKELMDEANGHHGVIPNGPFMLFDEFSFYSSGLSNWLKDTPELLEAGAPPYELALFSDGRAFTFDRLRKLLRDQLPSDLDQKLIQLPGYSELSTAQRRQQFFRQHLIPEGFTGILEAVSSYGKQPSGVKIQQHGSTLRIFNDHIGGVIPYAFIEGSDRIHLARLMIMRGQPVHFDEGFSEIGSDGCRHELEPEKYDGCKVSSTPLAHSYFGDLHGLPSYEDPLLPPSGGDTFVEAGQVYIRSNSWLDKACVPSSLAESMASFPEKPLNDSQEAFPAWSKAFHEQLVVLVEERAKRAENAILEAMNNGTLIKLAQSMVRYSSTSLNEYITNDIRITQSDVDDQEDDDCPADENDQFIDIRKRCSVVGEMLGQRLPLLATLDAASLGWAYFYAKHIEPSSIAGKYPGNVCDQQSLVSVLCCLVYIQNLLVSGEKPKISDRYRDVVLKISIEQLIALVRSERSGRTLTPVQKALRETMNVTAVYDEVSRFFDEVAVQKKQVAALEAHRVKQLQMEAMRSKGLYEYVNEPVSSFDDSIFSRMGREGRKYGGIMVTQSMADLFGTLKSLRTIHGTLWRDGKHPKTKRLRKLARVMSVRHDKSATKRGE